jgi:transposase
MLSGERRENGIIVAATKAGRDGFWRARWLRAQGIDAYVIHPNSIAVSREPRPPPGQACRAKTDRLDPALLKRTFLGWLRGERPRGGRQAAEPGAREPRRRAHAPRQPDEEHARTAWHPRLQTDLAHSRATARAAADVGGGAGATPQAG